MKLNDYLKNQIINITIAFFTIALVWVILWAFNCPRFLVFYVPFLILISFSLICGYDFWRKRNYYNRFIQCLSDLDEKYLITELIEEPHFIEGKIMVDSIYEIDKAMKEHLNKSLFCQSELKEYIEMWCHEVKTPVATSQMVIENNKNEINDSIKEELVKIDDYVEQVLFYARSENVEKDYLIKEVCLQDVVNTVIKRNKKDLISKKIRIDLDDLNIVIPSDKKWLEFILHQIINNAIKYSQNQPFIHIYAQKYKDHVELMIQDNGIGILESEIDRVFDKGFTGSNGRNFKKSTGIGLYLCKKLCLRLNHQIKIASSHGNTVVTIIFPNNSYITLH